MLHNTTLNNIFYTKFSIPIMYVKCKIFKSKYHRLMSRKFVQAEIGLGTEILSMFLAIHIIRE